MRVKNVLHSFVVATVLVCSIAHALGEHSHVPIASIEELETLKGMSIESIEDGILRSQKSASHVEAVRQVAVKTGLRRGRRWRQMQFNQWIADRRSELAITFNFSQLLIDGVYLPPRIDEVDSHVEKLPGGSMRYIRHAYRIASEPELVIEPPTFLNYLFQRIEPVEKINPLGLPRRSEKEELQAWSDGLADGWIMGVRQADEDFKADLHLLTRDYNGMRLYIDLALKNLVTMPSFSSTDFGIVVTADGKSLNIGDEVVTITGKPNFQHFSKWKAMGEKQ